MALEPVLATTETGESPELRDMTRRFWVATALTVPVFALEMGGHLFDIHPIVALLTSNWIQLLLGTPVVLWAGWPFFARAAASIRNRSLNMFSLIALGTGAAWLYSIVGTVAPALFPAALRSADGAVPVYFEAAAVITVLVLLGQVLELRAREKTSGAIKALLGLAPKTAVRVDNHGWRRQGRPAWRADPQCRGAGKDGEGGHAGGRQDRHPDRRTSEGCARRAVEQAGRFTADEVLHLRLRAVKVG
jgi:Cu+-exporting ATPase